MKLDATFLALMVIWAVCFQINSTAQDIAIVNVTVIDCTGSPAKSNMTILLTGDKISAIQKTDSNIFNAHTTIINGKGKFLIPGLWDMHVHCKNDSLYFPLMIANGVTSLRDMYNNAETFKMKTEWRNLINEGKLTGPNLYLPLTIMGPDQLWSKNDLTVATKKEVIEIVKEVKKTGADFIKVFDLYDPKIFAALLKEADKNRIRVCGHCPASVNIGDAADEGMVTFEHLMGILLASSSEESYFRNMLLQDASRVHDKVSDLTRILYFVPLKGLIESFDTVKANLLFGKLKKSHSYQCPTLVAYQGVLRIIDGKTECEQAKYVPVMNKKNWTDLKNHPFTVKITPDDYNLFRQSEGEKIEFIKLLCSYKIPMLAGTDANWNTPHVIPGFSLHDELSLLVKFGMTPMEALQAATRNGADALGVLDKTGTVEVGKCADLVLLDENPLENIRNTTKINSVIKGGNYLSREALDDLLHEVELKVKK